MYFTILAINKSYSFKKLKCYYYKFIATMHVGYNVKYIDYLITLAYSKSHILRNSIC